MPDNTNCGPKETVIHCANKDEFRPADEDQLRVIIKDNKVYAGERLAISFQRTLRIPDDGKPYPLPPGMGEFPALDLENYEGPVPQSWRQYGSVLIPMYQGEALWLAFDAAYWKPNAIKIGVGKINAVSGQDWDFELRDNPQDYIVCPEQPWLDGINAGDGSVRQFVAMPLGSGYTLEALLSGREEYGGIQIAVFDPKAGLFPDDAPVNDFELESARGLESVSMGEMGLGVGAQIKQKIYPDPYGIDTWNQDEYGSVFIHIVNSVQYEQITGHMPPPPPISAQIYAEHRLPWFDLYDEDRGDVAPAEELKSAKTISQLDAEKGNSPNTSEVSIQESEIKKLRPAESGKIK
ncbi:MAG TPA: hypothetical protein VGW12_07885 [Pyrinomonadaceae bacterium]|nr:hypothetical protein [Pyrinomonadaceae bacterium]